MLQFRIKKFRGKLAWLVFLVMLSLVTIGSPGGQSAEAATIAVQNLFGPWQLTLSGVTGCGLVSMLANFTLDTTGTDSNATLVTHGQCGDSTITGQTFTILSLDPNGSGTAVLSCGIGCGWGFNIQVAPDGTIFNVVVVTPTNPGNFIAGVAVHQ